MCREALDWEATNNEWIEECSTGVTCSFEVGDEKTVEKALQLSPLDQDAWAPTFDTQHERLVSTRHAKYRGKILRANMTMHG